MRNIKINIKVYWIVTLIVMLALLLLGTIIAIITYENSNVTNASPLLAYAIEHHLWIMVFLIILSVGIGFLGSFILYHEAQEKTKTSKHMLDAVMLFLSAEERAILNYLVEKGGETTQAEISRLLGMNRVKAFRSLQRMQEKQLIEISSHGKVRKVVLKENILRTLSE